MVASTRTPTSQKSEDKIPMSKHVENAKHVVTKVPVSPPNMSLEDEVILLRARNKILTDALQAVKESATDQAKRNFDLVWFARNRCRYPTHEASKVLERKYSNEIEELRGPNGDYHHGMHTGLLAASRMFKEFSNIPVDSDLEGWSSHLAEATKHEKKIEASRNSFPNASTEEFPTLAK
mmetsp:Transcript_16624/g.30237  ORF Transcript_16624/g.30237 Transcript_16624/m.30237 type:complete len:179 (+) Transcript_16624:115-651(+)